MSDYQNYTEQVVNMGLNLRDIPDRMEDGKWRRLTNVRSDEEGALTSRPGREEVADSGVEGIVHTLVKVNDAIIYGVGGVMYRNNTAYSTPWDDMPKTTVRHRAAKGEDKWLYVADAYQMKMLHPDGTEFSWGIPKPEDPITATVTANVGGLQSKGVNVYDWRYTYFSSRTGAESNPSKEIAGVDVRKKSVFLSMPSSTNSQVDKVKIYRRGGSLGQVGWKLVATINNVAGSMVGYEDAQADSEIQNRDELQVDNDLPFISISVEARDGGKELAGTPLPYIFGPFIGKYILGCGDRNRPNHVYWTNPGRPTSAGALNHIPVTAPDEPLIGGFIYGGLPYVFSREGFYALDYQGDDGIPVFTSRKLPIGRGVSSPYALAAGPQVFFLSKDGIYMSDMQGPAEPLTEKDIRPLFLPEQSSYDATIQGIEQIDWGAYTFSPPNPLDTETVLNKMRMSWGGRLLRLQYIAANSTWVHLVNDTPYDRWSNDYLATDALDPEWECIAYYDEEQPNTSWLIGSTKGRIFREAGLTDDGDRIQCRVRTRSVDFGMPQTLKELGNIIVDVDVNGAAIPIAVDPSLPYPTEGIAVTMYYNAETSSSAYQRVNGTGRQKFPLSLSDTYIYSVAVDLEWNGNGKVYQWDILWRMDEEWITHWEFPPTTFGAKGWTHMRDFYVTLRSTGEVTPAVVVDGVEYTPRISGSSGLIPTTAGEKVKYHLWMPPVKGKLYQVKLDGGPFRLYGEDSEMRVKEWATGLSYPVVNPFQQEGGGS